MPCGFAYKYFNNFTLCWSLSLPVGVRMLPWSQADFGKDSDQSAILFIVILQMDRGNLLGNMHINVEDIDDL